MASKSIVPGTKTRYKTFLKNVDLYAIGLESISANLQRQLYFDAFSKEKSEITNHISTNFSVSDYSNDHFDITGAFEFQMKNDQSADAILKVNISFSAHFHPTEGEFDREDVGKFAQSEARLLFWPYFRQALSDVTGRMYIRPVTIPFALKP